MSEILGAYFWGGLFLEGLIIGILWYVICFLRFTISTWIFMLEPCYDGLCGILNHRSTKLLTPLLSITSTGELITC